MLKNHLKIALRKLVQQKFYTIINIGGLALGIACFFLISMYVYRELNYDNFQKDKKNIYRVYRIEDDPSGKVSSAFVPNALPKTLKNDYPDLKNIVSIVSLSDEEINVGKNKFQEKILFASPNFFDMFNFQFQIGNYKQLNENINSIIITKQLANKLFGNKSPLGKAVTVHGQFHFIVAGILRNIPENSSFQFDAFISKDVMYKYILPEEEKKWYSMGIETFIEFNPAKLTPQYLQSQFPNFLNKYLPDYLKGRLQLGLQPLNDIHTNTDIQSDYFPPVSKTSLLVFLLIACTILTIASFNFINLVSAKQFEREKEVGVRKVVGAKRIQLVYQFLTESILMTSVSALLGFVLLEFLLPYFNNYIQPSLSLNIFEHSLYVLIAVLFVLTLGFMNGIYPALFLSKDKPAAILRKENKKLFGKINLRYSFMKNNKLGFLSENLIAINTNTNPTEKPDDKKINLFTEIINNHGKSNGIVSAAFSENVPGSYFPNQFSVIAEGKSDIDKKEMVITRNVNEDFFNTYKMKIVEGRNFSKNMQTDYDQAAIINETAAKIFGWENPIGKKFKFAFDKNS